jgi:hypothetical protein
MCTPMSMCGQGGVHARHQVPYRGDEVERGHARGRCVHARWHAGYRDSRAEHIHAESWVVGLSTLGIMLGKEAEQSSVDMRG